MKKFFAVITLFTCAFLNTAAQAAEPDVTAPKKYKVIFSNYDNDNPWRRYLVQSNYFVWFSSPNGPWSGPKMVATAFTPTEAGTIKKLVLAIKPLSNLGTTSASVSIRSDAGGVPGPLLTSFKITPTEIWGSLTGDGVKVLGTGVPVVAGTQYWLVATYFPHEESTLLWSKNSIGAGAPYGVKYNGSNQWVMSPPGLSPAFEIYGE